MENFFKEIKIWAKNNKNIESVILVGSYAKNTYKETSDIDLVIITQNKEEFIENRKFIKLFGFVDKSQIEYYGACTSIRVYYKYGMEVEFGFVNKSWIEEPLDKGTKKVLTDGYKVIIDKKEYFENISI